MTTTRNPLENILTVALQQTLSIIQQDKANTTAELARSFNISSSAALGRVRRLQKLVPEMIEIETVVGDNFNSGRVSIEFSTTEQGDEACQLRREHLRAERRAGEAKRAAMAAARVAARRA